MMVSLVPSTAIFLFPTSISLSSTNSLFFPSFKGPFCDFNSLAMSTVNGFRRMIRRFLENKIDVQDLARSLDTSKLSPLAVTSLDLPDIQKIFGLANVVNDVQLCDACLRLPRFQYVSPMNRTHQLTTARNLLWKVGQRSSS